MEETQDGTTALPEAQGRPNSNRRREKSKVAMVGHKEVAQGEEDRLVLLLDDPRHVPGPFGVTCLGGGERVMRSRLKKLPFPTARLST